MRNYQPKPLQETTDFGPRQLPTNQPCAVYCRQSQAKQVVDNPESARLQRDAQLKKARDWGWVDGIIFLFVENEQADGTIKSASGTLRIDQRAGLSALMERIYKDEIKTVFVYSVDRLFRDETQIQVDTFIQACKEHDVLVITEMYRFDFRRNPYDADVFRMLAKAAANFITQHVKGLLHPARRAVSQRGQADGRKVSIGYIVDRRKHLADGRDNPNYKRFVPYESHSRVVAYLFRRYKELGGNLRRLYREIDSWPFVFPFFVDPTHAKYVLLSKNEKGYIITPEGLAKLLTNVVYLGWWYHNGQVVSKHNHEAIVDEETFWYAFNKLSPYKLDGERNIRATSQVHNRTNRPEALLQDVIASTNNLPVYVQATQPPEYAMIDDEKRSGRYKLSIRVSELDAIFLDRLFQVLNDVDHGITIEERLREVRAQREQALVSVDEQIEQTHKKIARAERDKRIAEEEDYEDGIRVAIRSLKGLKTALEELQRKKDQADVEEAEIEECQDLLECVQGGWKDLPLERKRRFIGLITQSITISEASMHFLRLDIVWTGPYGCTDTGYIFRRNGTGGMYTEAENAIIRALYPIADRAVILERLPHRSWISILEQARRLKLSRNRARGNSAGVHEDISLNDLKVMQALGVEYDKKWLDKLTFWTSPNEATFGTSL
jgi:hypothetical protein